MAIQYCNRDAALTLAGPPGAKVEAPDEIIAGIPMPFGLAPPGGVSSGTESEDSDQVGRRVVHPAVRQPATQNRSHKVVPMPLRGAGGGLPSPDEAGSCLDGRTTVMIRRSPQDLTRNKLVWELEAAGFANLYDYIYIPLDRGRTSRPMTFVNFTDAPAAERFYKAFNGRRLRSCSPAGPVFVIPACVQGLWQNLAHHFACIHKGRSQGVLFFSI